MYYKNKQIEIMKISTYTYQFTNGTFTITKGIRTRFDWFVSVKLNDRFIVLNQNIFLTKKEAKKTTENLLNKYKLL